MLHRLIAELGIPRRRWGGNEHDLANRERLIRWAEQTGERPGFLFPDESDGCAELAVQDEVSPDYAFWCRQQTYTLADAAALCCESEPGHTTFKVRAMFAALLFWLGIEEPQNGLNARPQPTVTRERLIRWAEQTGERPGFLFSNRAQPCATRTSQPEQSDPQPNPSTTERRAATLSVVLDELKQEQPELDLFALPSGMKRKLFDRCNVSDRRLFVSWEAFCHFWKLPERKRLCRSAVGSMTYQ